MASISFVLASSCSWVTPPMVAVAPSGRSRASIFFWSAALTAPVSSTVGFAVTVAER